MIRDMFTEVNKLNTGLDVAWKRNEVIAHNIANADTPGFKRSSVVFEDYYRAALEDTGGDAFRLRRTREKHLDIGAPDEPVAQVVQDRATTMRMDGNNVDPDKEMADLAQNVIYYQTMQSKVVSELSQLRIAITGAR